MDQSHEDEGLEQPAGEHAAWWHTGHAGYAGHTGPADASPYAAPSEDPAITAAMPPVRPPWAPAPGGDAVGGVPPTQAGWAPPPSYGGPGAGGPPPYWGHYGLPPAPPGGPVGPPTRPNAGRRGILRVAAVVAVVAATTAAGIGVGHDLWRPSSSPAAAPPSSTTVPGGGGSAPGSTGNTGGGGLPFGNGEFPGFFPGTGGSGSSGGGSSSASGAPANASAIAGKVDPALVDIVTTLGYQGGEAAGTGIVLTSNGEVLTNNHVIDGATNIRVTDIGNGRSYTATVVGYSRTSDVAVIQLDNASGLTTASIGDSSAVHVGDGVVALGNAGGVGGTPSAAAGSVTGLDQTITASDQNGSNSETLTGLIEINANIQPGDSGGALADAEGRVIGMDTAASTAFASSTKDGYAIPINAALSIAQQIEAGQASSTVHIGRTGFLGVSVSAPQSGGSGAAIQSTVPDLPAAAAGLSAGDVITAVDGLSVNSPEGLTSRLLQHHPGDTVRLTYTDPSGQQHTVPVTLANGPAQ